MDEHILAALALDESESLTGVEPLYCSLFSQVVSLLIELFGAFPTASSQKTKRAASVDLQPLNDSKGFTRATNAK
jgi:hypothetical protein